MNRLNTFFSFLSLLLAAILVLFTFLGFSEVFQVSEGREGVVVKRMLETGDYILPLRHAEIVPSKPPLFHWVGASIAKLRGGYGEFELRFPSALSALLLVCALAYFGYALSLPYTGIRAGFLLLATNGLLQLAADGRVDMIFCLFVTCAVLRWMLAAESAARDSRGFETISNQVYREIGFLLGFAILAKGPLGLLLPMLIIATLAFSEQGIQGLKSVIRPSLAWSGVLSAPWYILATLEGKTSFLSRQVFFENFHRFVGGEGISEKPIWFYAKEFWVHAAPASLLFALLLCFIVRQEVAFCTRNISIRTWFPQVPSEQRLFRWTAIWMGVVFCFFSLSAGKRSAYLLLELPPLAVLLATVRQLRFPLQHATDALTLSERRFQLFGTVFWMLSVVAVSVPIGASELEFIRSHCSSYPKLEQYLFASHEALQGWAHEFWLFFAVLGLGGFLLWIRAFRLKSQVLAEISLFFLVQFLFVFGLNVNIAAQGVTHSYKKFAERVSALVPSGEKLTFIKKRADESFDGFFFYMDRNIYLYEPRENEVIGGLPDEVGWYLSRVSWLDEQPDRWTCRIAREVIGGRTVDAPERHVVLFRLLPSSACVSSEPTSQSRDAAGIGAVSQPGLIDEEESE